MTIRIVLTGFGDVGKNKFTPALLSLIDESHRKDFRFIKKGEKIELYIIDTDPNKGKEIDVLRKSVLEKNLNTEIFFFNYTKKDFLGNIKDFFADKRVSLLYIASPNKTHAKYIGLFLRKSDKIFVEKPLVDNLYEIEMIEQKYRPSEFSIVRLSDHYLFKDVYEEFLYNHKKYLNMIGNIREINFYLIESGIIKKERAWLYYSGMIRDLAVHYFSILFKLYEQGYSVLGPQNFDLLEIRKARYKDKYIPSDINNPKETFALLKFDIKNIESTCIVGKGLNFDRKRMVIKGDEGILVIDSSNNAIYLTRNKEKIVLFESKSKKYHEYWNLMRRIFNNDPTTGLSYNLAKEEVKIMEKTDTVEISKVYDTGEIPFGASMISRVI
ncbi:MAG: Gfo/Idh/MocA family oxidoreductase [Candidatus Korarchaeota archaeon]|nr:Gfo/Idh/MocA family oxidoreductase [Candidatus Korarchaeota archaeon]